MSKWFIKKIKNENTKYDFRLKPTRKNDYSSVNFQLASMFRILVSLSTHFTKNKFLAPTEENTEFFNIIKSGNEPTIFDFSIKKSGHKNYYASLSDDLKQILLTINHSYIYVTVLTTLDFRIFNSLFDYIEIRNLSQFFYDNEKIYQQFKTERNKDDYTQTKPQENLLITGWLSAGNSKNPTSLILDLLKYDNQFKTNMLLRCKINDGMISEYAGRKGKNIKGYCLFLVELKKNFNLIIKKIVPVSFDEYLTYLYNLMLPYKYDFSDFKLDNNLQVKDYDDNDVQRYAFAIDPDKSKDRDDAIGAFYLQNGKNVTSIENATHIKLLVHISDTLDFIIPEASNYYYNFSKYKTNTDYLNKYNLPMMDRVLSENFLSLDGNKKHAITTTLTYKILDNKKFIINHLPDRVEMYRSKNLKIIGTTYNKFATSFELLPSKGFTNKEFIKRYIIPCNKKIVRDYNQFIYEGKYKVKGKTFDHKIEKLVADTLKQLYICMVNSLDHAGKDSLLKIPSTLIVDKSAKNIYLDFHPIDMWAHSLIEYTAIETNIYSSQTLLLLSKNKNIFNNGIISYNINLINDNIERTGQKIQQEIIQNITNGKKIKNKEIGFFRNLYCPIDQTYLNIEIQNMIKNLSKRNNSENIVKKLIKYYYQSKNVNDFLKLFLSLRQMLILLNSKTNLDISEKLVSNDIKMKAKYESFPVMHTDIASYYYTHSTSPMRRFIDINVHHLIFNRKYKDYIFKNVKLDYINSKVDQGKQIHFLVNSYRFLEFIKANDKVIMGAKLMDQKRRKIGFEELINFFNFESTFNLIENKPTKVLIKLDSYELPILKEIYDRNEKTFNIFFHMLNREDLPVKIKKKIQKFMDIIFKVKKTKVIC